MKKLLTTSLIMLATMTVLTGIVYPLAVTGIAQLLFPSQANGSLVRVGGATVGSALIAQKFSAEKYFWPRPSAIDYNPVPSGASNDAQTNLALDTAIRVRREKFAAANHMSADAAVPVEMLNTSGSGLDPHISPEAALLQVGRVARARTIDSAMLAQLVRGRVEGRQWGLLGEPRVNVLLLNTALDAVSESKHE